MPATPAWPPRSLPRLFVATPLSEGVPVALDGPQANYLGNVMRLGVGGEVLLFDGASGEWLAKVADVGKRKMLLIVERRTHEAEAVPDLWLAFAPVKRAPVEWLVEKATELGIDQLIPLLTERTVVEPGAGKLDKLQAAVVAACKQSGRDLVMQVVENTPFAECLGKAHTADSPRTLLIGDPQGEMFQPEMIPHGMGEVLLLIGPEGGWSEAELEQATQAGAQRVRIADQILRTETAALQLAGLCVWARSRG